MTTLISQQLVRTPSTLNVSTLLKTFFIACIILLVSACASSGVKGVKVTEDDKAKYAAMSPEDAVKSLGDLLEKARADQLDFYTPNFYKEAFKLHEDAQKELAKKPKKDSIIEKVAKGDRLLARAQLMKPEVMSELEEIFKIRTNLDSMQTAKVFPKLYDKEMDKLMKVIAKIEQGNASKIAGDKKDLLKSMQALEVKAIRYDALAEADELKAKAKEINALKLAPATYAEAVSVYQTSEATINSNPHDKEAVANAKHAASFAAAHALYVTERVIELQKRVKNESEQIVLEEENRLLQIGKAMEETDVRDNPLGKQAELLAGKAAAMANTNKSNTEQLAQLQQLKDDLAAKDKQLSELDASSKKLQTELTDRNNQVVKLTADLVQAQGLEKKLQQKISDMEAKPVSNADSANEPAPKEENVNPETPDNAGTTPDEAQSVATNENSTSASSTN